MTPDPIADEILSKIPSFHPDHKNIGAATLDGREILVIDTFTLYSAGFIPSAADPTPRSEIYLRLDGHPSPSSTVTHGFLRFAPRDALKAPVFKASSKELHLWVDIEGLPQVMEQMKMTYRFLWVGFFGGGHVYGDLHAAN